MDLPKSSKEGGHADFRQESQDDEPGSSSSTAEEVALVQPKTRCCSGRYDNYTDPLDYLKCVGELLYT